MKAIEKLYWLRVTQADVLDEWMPAIWSLMALFDYWADTPEEKTEAQLKMQLLQELPHLWLAHTATGEVVGLGSLSDFFFNQPDEIPIGALIHGVKHPDWTRHIGLRRLTEHVLSVAFDQLGLSWVAAIFPNHHQGVRGFCWQYGFTPLGGLLSEKRLVMYLTRERYIQRRTQYHKAAM